MSWNLEGKRINGLYMGLFPYSGEVVESRVKYGGSVQHTVQVDEPFKVYGAMRERIVVETGAGEINRLLDPGE
jgi:predicted glycosyltransferase